MADWANQLADYGIEFEPRTAVKAQAFADFISKMTCSLEEIPSKENWKLYVDGSATKSCSGVGLLIISPQGARLEHAVRFSFAATNNKAEYKALLLGLGICLASGARKFLAYTDSQLIAGHVSGEFEAKDDSMKMYLTKVREAVGKFDLVTVNHIPRSENAQADAFSRLASSAVSDEPRNIIWEVLPCPSINAFVGGLIGPIHG